MLPKFQWNTTTKLIILILIVGLACIVLNYGLIEKFIGDEIINCPDKDFKPFVKRAAEFYSQHLLPSEYHNS